jgi:hypothetical protein
VRIRGLLLLAGLVVLAGCGSDRLSHSDYVERANAICAQYNATVKKLGRPPTVTAIERYARRTGRLYRAALAQLEELQPPKEDELTVADWLARDRRIAEDIAAIEAAARTRNIPAVRAATARAASDDRLSDSLAKLLGLTKCVG